MTNSNNESMAKELKHVDFLGESAYMVKVDGVSVMAAKSCFGVFKKLTDNQIIAKIDAMAHVWACSLKKLASQGRGIAIGFKNIKPGVVLGAPE